MDVTRNAFSGSDVRLITRRLTGFLARISDPPRGLEIHVGKGYHLLLRGAGARLLHVLIEPPDTGRRGAISTPLTSLSFRCAGSLSRDERRWLSALRQGLRLAEREPDWPSFLSWASRRPAVMLPDVSFDPAGDTPGGNLECVRVETRCNGRCPFCSARGILPDLVLDREAIVKRLRGMRRANRREVAFTGGEPTLRGDLPSLVASAREEGFSQITLQTNAILLNHGPLLDRLVDAGLTSIFVPLLSHEARTHDALLGVQGAFDRTLAGIDRCLAAGVEVGFNTVITTANLAHLASLVTWLPVRFPTCPITGNISYIALQGWAVDRLDLVPTLTAVRPHLRAALDACARLGLDITVPGLCGLPICTLPGYEQHFEEYHRGFQGVPENRRYTAACADCPYRERCSGFWSLYLDHFGEDELGFSPGTASEEGL